jgi:hypothetical protein
VRRSLGSEARCLLVVVFHSDGHPVALFFYEKRDRMAGTEQSMRGDWTESAHSEKGASKVFECWSRICARRHDSPTG